MSNNLEKHFIPNLWQIHHFSIFSRAQLKYSIHRLRTNTIYFAVWRFNSIWHIHLTLEWIHPWNSSNEIFVGTLWCRSLLESQRKTQSKSNLFTFQFRAKKWRHKIILKNRWKFFGLKRFRTDHASFDVNRIFSFDFHFFSTKSWARS